MTSGQVLQLRVGFLVFSASQEVPGNVTEEFRAPVIAGLASWTCEGIKRTGCICSVAWAVTLLRVRVSADFSAASCIFPFPGMFLGCRIFLG